MSAWFLRRSGGEGLKNALTVILLENCTGGFFSVVSKYRKYFEWPVLEEMIEEHLSVRQRLTLWAVEHFRCLPTDERIKSLSEHQLIILFLNSAHSLSDEDFRRNYARYKMRQESKEDLKKAKEEMLEMGYSEEEAAEIVEDL